MRRDETRVVRVACYTASVQHCAHRESCRLTHSLAHARGVCRVRVSSVLRAVSLASRMWAIKPLPQLRRPRLRLRVGVGVRVQMRVSSVRRQNCSATQRSPLAARRRVEWKGERERRAERSGAEIAKGRGSGLASANKEDHKAREASETTRRIASHIAHQSTRIEYFSVCCVVVLCSHCSARQRLHRASPRTLLLHTSTQLLVVVYLY